jgi:hydrogenase maturation protease
MSVPRILVAGIGNVFLGDDAFGVEVVRRLAMRAAPEGVCVADFGIRGLDLAYALLDDWEAVILVDAVPRGQPPGTLYVLEPEAAPADDDVQAEANLVEAHGMNPMKVLRLARSMGARPQRMLLVGCEPAPLDAEDMSMEISEPVRAVIDDAVKLVESLIVRVRNQNSQTADSVGGATVLKGDSPCRQQEPSAPTRSPSMS